MPIQKTLVSSSEATPPATGTNIKNRQHDNRMPFSKWLKIYILPPEHGGWFLLLGPYLFGAVAAAEPNADLVVLLLFALASYIARQPLTLLVKALSGRRARSDVYPALGAFCLTGLGAALLFGVLVLRGYAFLLWLGIPASIVMAWQLWLVTRRRERQIGIELVGAGTLALAAPAAYWVSAGAMTTPGWWLWLLAWLYAASSIVYVYLRLKQRRMKEMPPRTEQWREGRRTLLYTGASVVLTAALAVLQYVPTFVPLVFVLAAAHFVYGITHPCVGVKPARIGIEQSLATLGFYVVLGIVFAL